MKRILAASAVALFILFLSGCSAGAKVPDGFTNKEEHFGRAGLQDFTDYCKYSYNDNSPFENDPDYRQISGTDIAEISGYFENFRSCMEALNRTDEYDFDTKCITPGDYVYITDKEGERIGNSLYEKYDDYTVRFFDTDSRILYYLHFNI